MFIKAMCGNKRCYINTEYIVDVFENESDPDMMDAYLSTDDECTYTINRKDFELLANEMIMIDIEDEKTQKDFKEAFESAELGIITPAKLNIKPIRR